VIRENAMRVGKTTRRVKSSMQIRNPTGIRVLRVKTYRHTFQRGDKRPEDVRSQRIEERMLYVYILPVVPVVPVVWS